MLISRKARNEKTRKVRKEKLFILCVSLRKNFATFARNLFNISKQFPKTQLKNSTYNPQ